jgi:hypothetical protein
MKTLQLGRLHFSLELAHHVSITHLLPYTYHPLARLAILPESTTWEAGK